MTQEILATAQTLANIEADVDEIWFENSFGEANIET